MLAIEATLIVLFFLFPLGAANDALQDGVYTLPHTFLLGPARVMREFFSPVQKILFKTHPQFGVFPEQMFLMLDNATSAIEVSLHKHGMLAEKALQNELEGFTTGATASTQAEVFSTVLSAIVALIESQNRVEKNIQATTGLFGEHEEEKPASTRSMDDSTESLVFYSNTTYVSTKHAVAGPVDNQVAHMLSTEDDEIHATQEQTMLLNASNVVESIQLFSDAISRSLGHPPNTTEHDLTEDFLNALLISRVPLSDDAIASLVLDTLSFINATQRLECPPREAFRSRGLAELLRYRIANSPKALAAVMLDFYCISCIMFANRHESTTDGSQSSSVSLRSVALALRESATAVASLFHGTVKEHVLSEDELTVDQVFGLLEMYSKRGANVTELYDVPEMLMATSVTLGPPLRKTSVFTPSPLPPVVREWKENTPLPRFRGTATFPFHNINGAGGNLP